MAFDLSKLKLEQDLDSEPLCDRGKCDECSWEGPLEECDIVRESVSEMGPYYDAPYCPECGAGCECDMSEEQAEAWLAWNERRKREAR